MFGQCTTGKAVKIPRSKCPGTLCKWGRINGKWGSINGCSLSDFFGGVGGRTITTQVDPNAKLIYNDNKVEGAGLPNGRSAKADAMYEMLKGKLERGREGASRTWMHPNALRVICPSVRSEREISSLVALRSFTIRF